MSTAAGETKVISLYQSQKKIYAKSVVGRFANLRVFMVFFTQAIFYGLAWLPWNGRQAVLFDLNARKFYISPARPTISPRRMLRLAPLTT